MAVLGMERDMARCAALRCAGMSTFSTKGGLYERAQRRFGVADGKRLFTYAFFEKQRLKAMVRASLKHPILRHSVVQRVCSAPGVGLQVSPVSPTACIQVPAGVGPVRYLLDFPPSCCAHANSCQESAFISAWWSNRPMR